MTILSKQKKISLKEKKSIMLHMMDEIDAFCRENELKYFLVGGTLLGAIRHKGYIPWDDDIDIGMPREDFNIFINSFASKSGNVKVINYQNYNHYIWPSAKVIDNRTKLIELGNTKSSIGVFIDVFPFDGVIGTYEDLIADVKSVSLWKNMLELKYLRIDPKRSIIKNIVVTLGKVLKIVPDKWLIKKINSIEKKSVPFSNCDYVCNFNGAWGTREITKSINFLETIDGDFEGRKYCIPVGYDDYLKTVYGDYMKLPPKEQQVTHHSSEAYWR